MIVSIILTVTDDIMDYLTLIKQLQVGVKNYHYRLGEEIEEHQDEIASEKDKEMVEDPEVVIASKGDEEIEFREKTAGKVVSVTEEDPEVIASEGDEEIQERPKKIAPKMTKKARARHARMLSVILLRKFPSIILLTYYPHTFFTGGALERFLEYLLVPRGCHGVYSESSFVNITYPICLCVCSKDCYDAGIHRAHQAGIQGSKMLGACSIVVSGEYDDDKDFGDTM